VAARQGFFDVIGNRLRLDEIPSKADTCVEVARAFIEEKRLRSVP
jgi:hypothetical protein